MKTILVTGASSGFGMATSIRFANKGWQVIAWARRMERMNAWKSTLPEAVQGQVILQEVDVRDARRVSNALASLPEGLQAIDVLINNAGLAVGKDPIHEASMDDWERMIDTNLKGLLYVTRAVSPGMVARNSGHIINIGSIAGKESYPEGNVYNATKYGVDGLTRSMRMDLVHHGIRVSQVCPGMVDTEFSQVRFQGNQQKAQEVYQNMQPLTSEDIADVLDYMISAPRHVNIADVLILPTAQASATIVHRKAQT